MTYAESVAWLYAQQRHGIHPGLGRMERLLEALGQPHRAPGLSFLHVAGTNGKGSVCAMLEAMLRAAGRRAGLFTSPHLVSFRERIRVGAAMIPEGEAAEGLTAIRAWSEQSTQPPTFFEIVTALALGWFQRAGVELAVLETGLGGRLDATNVVTPLASVVTSIDLDHQEWLGGTRAEIAREKGGIFKPGVPALSAPQMPEVARVLEEVAAQRGVGLTFVAEPLRAEVGLAGSHQALNAALAVQTLAAANLPAPFEALRTVEWPGRFQHLEDRLILDGAHNPAAAERLVQTWREVYGTEQATLILGALGDKDVRGVCAALGPLAARVYAVTVPNERSLPAAELQAVVAAVRPGLECATMESIPAALAAARGCPERTLVAGSLFLVGEVLRERQGGGDGQRSLQ